MVCGLAAAEQVPDAAWMDLFWAAAYQALPSFTGGQLSRSLRALGYLGEAPPKGWDQRLTHLMAAAAAASTAAAAPPPGGLQHREVALVLSPAEVADVLWGLASLQLQPDRATMAWLLRQASADFEALTHSLAADLGWAIAALGYRPSNAWLLEFTQATLQLGLPMFGAPDVGKLAWALASFNFVPSDEWLQAWMLEAVYHPDYSPQGAAAVLWSLATFQVLPELLWIKTFYSLTAGRLAELPADGLGNVLWALAAVETAKSGVDEDRDFRPPAAWLDEWLREAAEQLPEFDLRGLVKVAWALAALQLQPPDAWLRPLLDRLAAALAAQQLEPMEVVYVARAVGSMLGGQQRPSWAQRFLQDVLDWLEQRRGELPPGWRRLDVRRPPYAAAAAAAGDDGDGAGAGSRGGAAGPGWRQQGASVEAAAAKAAVLRRMGPAPPDTSRLRG